MLIDGHRRTINYLRLSVTDRCNLRCRYCMPSGGLSSFEREDLLTRDEILTVARAAVELGIRKIRITGGEPLVRKDIVELLTEISALHRLDRLVLTTNGIFLPRLAKDLVAAGVSGVNISIDSLDASRFDEITRGGKLSACLEGIDAALDAGMRTKLNVVVMRGLNDDEIADFAEFARTRPIAIRFIEYMPTRGLEADAALTLPTADLLDILQRIGPLKAIERNGGHVPAGPARNYRLGDSVGTLGVISPITCQFCQDCNRIRVTSDGFARSCLFHATGLDLKQWLRQEDWSGLLDALRTLVADKPLSHRLEEDDGSGTVPMSRVGG